MAKDTDKKNGRGRAHSDSIRYWAALVYARGGVTQEEVAEYIRSMGFQFNRSEVSTAYASHFRNGEQKDFPVPRLRVDDMLLNAREELALYQIRRKQGRIDNDDAFALTQIRLVNAIKELEEISEAERLKQEVLVNEKYQQLFRERGLLEAADALETIRQELLA